jgi:hypothetical protein
VSAELQPRPAGNGVLSPFGDSLRGLSTAAVPRFQFVHFIPNPFQSFLSQLMFHVGSWLRFALPQYAVFARWIASNSWRRAASLAWRKASSIAEYYAQSRFVPRREKKESP